MKIRIGILIITAIALVSIIAVFATKRLDLNPSYEIGDPVDSLNHVVVYYNGGISNVTGRNLTKDGYNLGLKYQCVEFVKRYYYEYLNHKMPNSYGHAVSFFQPELSDGGMNEQRNLNQYSNPSESKPQINDLVVFGGTTYNPYGHVAIISEVWDDQIEIIQQNPGPWSDSRIKMHLYMENGKWKINDNQLLGWLRKE